MEITKREFIEKSTEVSSKLVLELSKQETLQICPECSMVAQI